MRATVPLAATSAGRSTATVGSCGETSIEPEATAAAAAAALIGGTHLRRVRPRDAARPAKFGECPLALDGFYCLYALFGRLSDRNWRKAHGSAARALSGICTLSPTFNPASLAASLLSSIAHFAGPSAEVLDKSYGFICLIEITPPA